jgi:hypothetical protein
VPATPAAPTCCYWPGPPGFNEIQQRARTDILLLSCADYNELAWRYETWKEREGLVCHHFTFAYFTDVGMFAIGDTIINETQIPPYTPPATIFPGGRYVRAVQAARSARFEHGEIPS